MSELWRSKDMSYISLIFSDSAAKTVLRELGVLGLCEFEDLNRHLTPFQRTHFGKIKRLEKIEKSVKYLYDEVISSGLKVPEIKDVHSFLDLSKEIDVANVDEEDDRSVLSGNDDDDKSVFSAVSINNLLPPTTSSPRNSTLHTAGNLGIETLDSEVSDYMAELTQLNEQGAQLRTEYIQKLEYQYLLSMSLKLNSPKHVTEMEKSMAHMDQGEDRNALLNDVESANGGNLLSPIVSPGHNIEMRTLQSIQEVAAPSDSDTDGEDNRHAGQSGQGEMAISHIEGTIELKHKPRFERMLYRATRGNVLVRFSSLEHKKLHVSLEGANDLTQYQEHLEVGKLLEKKLAFVIFYKSASIESKIVRICDAFMCDRYSIQNIYRSSALKRAGVRNEQNLKDSLAILSKNAMMRMDIVNQIKSSLYSWFWAVRQENSTYFTLNKMKVINKQSGSMFLRAKAWIPEESYESVKQCVENAHKLQNVKNTSLLERMDAKGKTAPTYFATNQFTWAFQEFVNTYGVPRYREINPALLTIATFPFLFGVMYGDIGHASIVTIGALVLLWTAEKNAGDRSLDEMVLGMYKARYMLVMMGACAVYCGFIYNDFFSLTWDLFGSGYQFNEQSVSGEGGEAARATIADGEEAHLVKGNYGDPQYIYPFGVDPAWHMSNNDLLFFNSLKMKFSVIVGIVHMSVGILIKGMNSWYFNQKLDFYAEFLPQILFAISLFGYMIVLIFIKWSINWDDRMRLGSCGYDIDGVHGNCNLGTSDSCYSISGLECDINTELVDLCPLDFGGSGDGCQPPNLITTLMNIALKPGYVDEPMFAGQEPLQLFLIVFAFLCVPWMLVIKPLVLWQEHAHEHDTQSVGGANTRSVQEKGSQTAINPLAPASASAYGALSTEPEQEGGMYDESTSKASNAGSSDGEDDDDGNHEIVEEHSMTEIVIHQGIETIEFVLGMVSNTASYLRLWALTLAHSELAHVFWEKCMVTSIGTCNSFAIVVGFFIFAGVTFGVLLVMDVLECFLHAMRLQWVEFQNKFYKADGVKFKPFDLKELLLDSRF